MVMEKLGQSLKNVLKKIAGAPLVDEKLINELIKDIQRALLYADVNVNLVFELSKHIKDRALEKDFPKGLSYRDYLVRIVYEELVKFLGGDTRGIKIGSKRPFKIMMIGLFGNGKTTSSSKLAKYYSQRGYKVALVGLDIHRPAAMKQLKQLGDKIGITTFVNENEKNISKLWKINEPEINGYDVVIIDTSGRDALSEDLVKEIESLNQIVLPQEKLLVLSGDLGQTAEKQAKQFHKSCKITGVMATKMDGTAKAGGALSACSVTGAPIKFIGTGEKVEDIEEFDPERFVGRLLGMGDIKSLLEKAEQVIGEEDAKDLGKKFLKGDFNFLDLYEQMAMMKKMGPLNKIMDMIPGMSKANLPKEALEVQEDKLKKWKHIMQSMTKKELEDPDLMFNRKRIDRVAKGSGVNSSEVRELLKHYRQSKKMAKMMKGNPEKIMKKFKGKNPF